ncbi:hypothetical protein MSG28_008223 [Choristoneura fumiferana]|uniref:Uncharacterized protein n=1 Tax=Choristoneura fumiferana TaxID=7141 RepID=A0ACC0JAH6_CHOFU|nr:hypothetical protein MSG28_008223 [Choristoneura fumiferana]
MGGGNLLPSEAHILQTWGGNGILIFRGYKYSWRNSKKRGGAYWTCSSHQKKGCKANVSTEETDKAIIVTKYNCEHTHSPPVIPKYIKIENKEKE